jgi:hypothetical protein
MKQRPFASFLLAFSLAFLAPWRFIPVSYSAEPAAAPAPDPDHAVATMSNGERAEGALAFTGGRKPSFFDVAKQKRFDLDPAEIVRVSVSVEEEKLAQGWMFLEESRHDKVKLPYTYPLRKLVTEVTLTSGETLKGHVTAVFYLETEESQKRFFLLYDQKGEKGQKLEDLVYLKELVLPNRKAGGKSAGTIQAPKGPAAVVNVDREVSFQPPFTSLPTGRYDVFLFQGAAVRYGLTGAPVAPEDLKKIEAKMALIEEFYTGKRVAAAAREGDTVRALVELTRKEESYDKGFRYVRWELWTFEPTQQSWDIRKRLYLHRERLTDEKALPAFEYRAEDRLKGVNENAKIE